MIDPGSPKGIKNIKSKLNIKIFFEETDFAKSKIRGIKIGSL